MNIERVIVLGRAESGDGVAVASATEDGLLDFEVADLSAVLDQLGARYESAEILIGVEAGAGDDLTGADFSRLGNVTVARASSVALLPDAAALCEANPDLSEDRTRLRLLAEALFNLQRAEGRDAAIKAAQPGADPMPLRAALNARVAPPRLKDDCFAMPQGVDWVPVDAALERLRAALYPVKATRRIALKEAAGLVLSSDAIAHRSNPPRPNSAVDGYGFAHAHTGSGPQRLPLAEGRAAAGQPFEGAVPPGAAIRILTGAILPEGVDTVVLEEDTAIDGAAVVFDGPVKPFANTRKAGEDVAAGDLALPAGHRLRAPDLALLAALGVAGVEVFENLRVGVLSTGDEIIADPADPALPHQIWDANRPMLLDLARSWGYLPVDLGHVRDDPQEIEARLTEAAGKVDVILTSGGASAGDEDHVSALLRSKGTLSSWRIALKPGRPLALALWQGVPVFGLPGNPVAALVCALIFARPAFSLMSGGGWLQARGFDVPAAFGKSKKPGRREFLRARLTAEGHAEVFRSEGSGRISGLAWAEGLVELPDEAVEVRPGDPVRFLPYPMLGLS
ncbi:MAG: molybdenum cofactor synthesis domain-containing protein [Thalassovita sp.]|nr:molybdenum cofactor synthesis domain-containing protein [Thalassovita sp.]